VLIAVDLPALLRPTKAISGSPVSGSWSSWLAVVKKRALCAQARASLRGGWRPCALPVSDS
jgi:hypothetical protein